jgi:hypothetical protein
VYRRIAVTKRRHAGRSSVLAVAGIIVSLGLVACGSSGPNQEELSRAKKEAANHVHKEDRLRRLEKELKEVHKQGKTASSAPNPAPSPAPTPVSEGPTSCGGDLTAGPSTSCPFAENVRAEYEDEIGVGSGSITAYSPANNEVYEMFCTAGSPHECTGAIDASVYFP